MRRLAKAALVASAAGAAFVVCAGAALAEPLVPSRDDEVVEVLPASAERRAEARRARRALAARPDDAALAVRTAERHLADARASGDPRFAGLAVAALGGFPDDAKAPPGVVLMRATLQQHLHDFDGAAATLERLLARRDAHADPQAWLTLATVRRVQGRLDTSDAACRRLADAARGAPHGDACLAENAALRGDVAPARETLRRLRAKPGLPVPTAIWLVTTLAELEQRDGQSAAAEQAYRDALRLGDDPYAALAYADFLLQQGRNAEAHALLAGRPRSDAVVLRLAIAGSRLGRADARNDAADMRQRIAQSNERPDAVNAHGREQALFALDVDGDAARAVALARANAARQREPLDLYLYARAARQAKDAAALADVQRLKREVGLHDRRIDALL